MGMKHRMNIRTATAAQRRRVRSSCSQRFSKGGWRKPIASSRIGPQDPSPPIKQAERNQEQRNGQRNFSVILAGHGIQDVPAIQLSAGKQVQRRREQSDPRRAPHGMQQQISRRHARPQNGNEQAHRPAVARRRSRNGRPKAAPPLNRKWRSPAPEPRRGIQPRARRGPHQKAPCDCKSESECE